MNAKRRTTASKLRTAEQARQWLVDNGMSVAAFAEANGLSRHAVNNALRIDSKCRIGKTHAAAVALGMKAAPDSHTESPKSARIRTTKRARGVASATAVAATAKRRGRA
ncbi:MULTISPECIES: DNA-binding protein [Stenotrophomonas]|uniref:DNA-binding protein n=1 Tax=Stenotrophomonas TaxID=40323 RepID=UPI0009F3D339|nr:MULTISPECIES: DNA-binding protein [Stenotrophomonas]